MLRTLILSGVLILAATSAALGQDKAPIDHYLTESTIGGIRVNVDRIDIDTVQDWAKKEAYIGDEETVEAATMAARGFLGQLNSHGVKEIWGVFDLSLIAEGTIIVVTFEEGKATNENRDFVARTLSGISGELGNFQPQVKDDHVVLITEKMEAVLEQRKGESESQRELPDELMAADSHAIVAFFAPSDDQHRALAETSPATIPPFSSVNLRSLMGAVDWISISIDTMDAMKVSAEFIPVNPEETGTIKSQLSHFIKDASEAKELQIEGLDIAEKLRKIKIEKQEDRVVIVADQSNGLISSLGEVSNFALRGARGSARRSQSMNNMKQIALAMHNYHDVYKGFPPRYSTDKDGKPLLSWRVLILPFIEQQALYEQFHLDEPWDSEHNIKLAETLVQVYQSPGLGMEGKSLSHYQVATGDNMALDSTKNRGISEIRDGTSNTLLVVEVDNDHASIWTKPDDYEFDAANPTAGLRVWEDGVLAGFCDGSVRVLSTALDKKMWKLLFEINDGEIVELDR